MKTKSKKAPAKGPVLESHQIIVRPLVTEKGMFLSTSNNTYTFEVNPLATKTQIKKAVEELFNVKVATVHTQNKKGKPRRYRFRMGRTKDAKKALVKLTDDHRIDFF
jgi:large subunit ribosomal protein L23